MSSSLKLLLLIGLFSLLCCANSEQTTIQQLNAQNFDETISSNKYVMVQFYSPTCPYCKIFEPEYLVAAKTLSEMGIIIAKVNQKQNSELGAKVGIQSLPSIFLYDQGQPIVFAGNRNSLELVGWCKNYLSNRIQELSSESKSHTFFGIQTNNPHHLNLLNKASYFIVDSKFYKSTTDSDHTKIYFQNKQGQKTDYSGELSFKSLKHWMKEQSVAPIRPLIENQQIESVLLTETLPSLILLLRNEDEGKYQKFNMIEKYCKENSERIKCGKIVEGYSIFQGSHSFFRDQSNRTLLAIVKQHMRIAYVLPQKYDEITESSLSSFVENSLADKLPRTVDNTLPTSVEFTNVPIFDNDTFIDYAHNNRFFVAMFYDPQDETSKYFSTRFQALYDVMKKDDATKDVGLCAVNCQASKDFCQERVIQYYPTIRLYADGFSLEYPKQKNLPEIPDIQKFVEKKISSKVITVQDLTQVKEPALVMTGPQLLPDLQTLAVMFDTFSVCYKKTESEKYTLDLQAGGQKVAYEGNFDAQSVKQWVNSQTGPLLSDLMLEIPDDRIINAIQNRKPIVFLLDVQKDKSSRIKAEFGMACKKLKIAGAYADSSHPGFSSLLEWVKIKNPSKSTIVYSQTLSDRKYIYPHPLQEFTSESFSQFLDDIKSNKIPETGTQPQPVKQERESPKQEQVEILDL